MTSLVNQGTVYYNQYHDVGKLAIRPYKPTCLDSINWTIANTELLMWTLGNFTGDIVKIHINFTNIINGVL